MSAFFPILIFNARPAAGKSEILQALRNLPERERIDRFHVGPMHVIDDFPMLWAWFEEDALLEQVFHRPGCTRTPTASFFTMISGTCSYAECVWRSRSLNATMQSLTPWLSSFRAAPSREATVPPIGT